MKNRKKISRQLFLLILIFAIIPLAILSLRFYFLAKEELKRTSFMHMHTLSVDYSSHTKMWLNERGRDAKLLAKLPSVKTLCLEHFKKTSSRPQSDNSNDLLEEILSILKEHFSCFHDINILDYSGKILATTSRNLVSLPLDKNTIHQCENDTQKDIFLGAVHRHQGKGWFIQVVSPIRDTSKNPLHTIGFVVGDLEISHAFNRLATGRVGLGKTGEIYIVSASGIPITNLRYKPANTANEESIGSLIKIEGVKRVLNHEKGTSIYKNYAGETVVGSYLWLDNLKVGVIAEIHKSEIMAPLRRIGYSAFLTLGILFTLCVIISYYVSNHISAPIITIAETAKKIADGDLNYRLSLDLKNEIGVLAEAFNSMTEQLATTIKTLEEKEKSIREAYHELKDTQAQLVQSEKMAAIGELVASIVHEMRNPLSSIKLNLQIIGRKLDRDSQAHEHYKIAIDQVAHLDKMFSELLNYSKPIVLDKIPILPDKLVDRALKHISEKLSVHNIKIIKKFEENLPPVEVDVDKIIQVIVNVLNNAIDAIEDDGKIEIKTRFTEMERQKMVDITISDSGVGIPEHQLEHIFKTFFTTKKKGTGLGLTVVKKIMEAHQGRINVKSRVGEGTTVVLSLPIKDSK